MNPAFTDVALFEWEWEIVKGMCRGEHRNVKHQGLALICCQAPKWLMKVYLQRVGDVKGGARKLLEELISLSLEEAEKLEVMEALSDEMGI